jgi:hypothetical protein
MPREKQIAAESEFADKIIGIYETMDRERPDMRQAYENRPYNHKQSYAFHSEGKALGMIKANQSYEYEKYD